MKRTLIASCLLILFYASSIAQNFEGKVNYQNSFKSKIPNVTDDMLTQMMGTTVEYNLKEGNYKTISNGTFLLWQLYVQQDNKLYTKFANSNSIFWNDGAENKDEVLKIDLNKKALEILGYKCDELVLTCKSGVQKYYFTSKFKVDPKLFKNHRFGNFYEYVLKSQAVPLKISIDNIQFSMESVATSVQEEEIDDTLFELPEDAMLEKNPYN
jgi:hypothetical protein